MSEIKQYSMLEILASKQIKELTILLWNMASIFKTQALHENCKPKWKAHSTESVLLSWAGPQLYLGCSKRDLEKL